MRTKVTLVLLFLNVVLFYYIFHYEKKWEAERRYQESRQRVFPTEAASIASFTRTTRAGETVRLEKRSDNTWWLTKPYAWPANPNAVSRITTELNFLEHLTSFEVKKLAASGMSLADYGLDRPAVTFEFTAAGGKTFTIKIGDETKSRDRLYVLSPDGAAIHVVQRQFGEIVGLPVEKLRADAIFSIPPFEVRSLSVQTAPLKVRLIRDGDRWRFETPISARANKNKVDVTVTALSSLLIGRFIESRDAAKLATGLENPTLRVTIEGNARWETLLIGAALPAAATSGGTRTASDDEYYARVEEKSGKDKSAIFTVALPADLIENLSRAQETLRDTRILDFDQRAITSLTLLAPNAANKPELTLQRLETAAKPDTPARADAAEAWQLTARTNGQNPQTLTADTAVVQDLLQKLYLLDARSFLTDAPSDAEVENYGLKSPEREIRLALAGTAAPPRTGATEIVLQIGTSPGQRDTAYARLTNPPYIYRIDRAVLDETLPLMRRFRDHTRELPAGAKITALKLTDLATGTTVFERSLPTDSAASPEGLAQPGDSEARRKALADIVGEIRVLHAKEFVADRFNPERAEPAGGEPNPWKYRLHATLALVGGNGTAQTTATELLLTERLGGTTQLVGTTEFQGGAVFEASQRLLDALFVFTYAANDPGPPVSPAPATAVASPAAEPPKP